MKGKEEIHDDIDAEISPAKRQFIRVMKYVIASELYPEITKESHFAHELGLDKSNIKRFLKKGSMPEELMRQTCLRFNINPAFFIDLSSSMLKEEKDKGGITNYASDNARVINTGGGNYYEAGRQSLDTINDLTSQLSGDTSLIKREIENTKKIMDSAKMQSNTYIERISSLEKTIAEQDKIIKLKDDMLERFDRLIHDLNGKKKKDS